MLDNKKLLITVVTLALVGVLALFAYSTTIKPTNVSLENIDTTHIGQIITTNGTITHARSLSDGSLSLELSDIDSMKQLEVYFPSSIVESWEGGNLTPGTVIQVTGEVMLYQESLEISIASAQDLIVISRPDEIKYDISTIMQSIEMFDGMEVQTNGTILDMSQIYNSEGLLGTSFVLYRDYGNESYSLECMCFNRTLEQFEEWDEVKVTGTISFYTNKGCWQLIIELVEPV
ncbi:MAG: hypothetical protein KAJ33_06400 [Thermoplasmata archaeon]|nr:hypothetical protein [Thermoplasmata archaeon]MCK5397858.1 hypothetical protein [Thermoplasmata archaeon]